MQITKIPNSRSYVLTFSGVVEQLTFKIFLQYCWLRLLQKDWKKMFKSFGDSEGAITHCKFMLQNLQDSLQE